MKNLKVVICCGIAASGKSTWAKQFVKDNPSWIRVNRDDIREMIKSNFVLNSKGEDYVTVIQSEMIDSALMMNYNVIVDNTNLKVEYIEAICEQVKYKADVEFKFFPIELKEALKRNWKRDRIVPDDIINRMYDQYLNLVKNEKIDLVNIRKKQTQMFKNPVYNGLPEAIIVDIDGTIAHMNGKRSPYDMDQVFWDDCDFVVREHIQYHSSKGRKIIFVSGRDDISYELTERWLKSFDIPYDYLFMRNTGDERKDSFVKEDIFNTHIKDIYSVFTVFDDRQQVVDMWRKLGLKCFQVQAGKF